MVASHTDPSIPFFKASYRRMEGMAVCHNLFYFDSLYPFFSSVPSYLSVTGVGNCTLTLEPVSLHTGTCSGGMIH